MQIKKKEFQRFTKLKPLTFLWESPEEWPICSLYRYDKIAYQEIWVF